MRPRTNQEHNALAADVAADAYYRMLSRPLPFFVGCALHVAIPFGVAGAWRGLAGVATLWVTLVVIYNLGDAIDSFAHLYGVRPFRAAHQARNNTLLGYLTLGEGWHANHHVFPGSARHGLLPGQFDAVWCIIWLLERTGLASEINTPAPELLRRRLASAQDS
jgi:fatty-acid desaturase